jgi:hypothetical protein
LDFETDSALANAPDVLSLVTATSERSRYGPTRVPYAVC